MKAKQLVLALALLGCHKPADIEADKPLPTPQQPAQPTQPAQPVPVQAAPSASSSKEPQVLTINSNTQATLDDLRIAAFNFRDETYKDDSGAEKTGRTCALHVFVKDDDSKDVKQRVWKGKKFSVNGKTFEVLDVAASVIRISVK